MPGSASTSSWTPSAATACRFTGGTGLGEKWTGDGRTKGYWRQTDVRVEGPIVSYLQAAFAENWRDATGFMLGGDPYFPAIEPRGTLTVQAIKSSPASGAAAAYTLFLLAIDASRSSILITNPYFVPDGVLTEAVVRAVKRGVDVSIMTAGDADTTLDRLVRQASQAHFGRVLEAGAKIYEYGPALLHAKTMVVDGQWVSIGSANLDSRSFALNNELNLAFLDEGLAARVTGDLSRRSEIHQTGDVPGLAAPRLAQLLLPAADPASRPVLDCPAHAAAIYMDSGIRCHGGIDVPITDVIRRFPRR